MTHDTERMNVNKCCSIACCNFVSCQILNVEKNRLKVLPDSIGDLQLLQTCPTISLPDVEGATSCPSVRACPTCGMRVQHNQQHCKNIHCPRCQVPFCFLCLKLKRECNQTSSPYEICVGGVAPRQTSIPVWHRK